MPTAVLIGRDTTTYAGPANHYLLDPPLSGLPVVTVFLQPGYDIVAPRAVVVPVRTDGTHVLNAPLPGSFSLQHDVTIDEAAWFALLAAGGYEIVEPVIPDPGSEPEPSTGPEIVIAPYNLTLRPTAAGYEIVVPPEPEPEVSP